MTIALLGYSGWAVIADVGIASTHKASPVRKTLLFIFILHNSYSVRDLCRVC
ncbi:MAG: hypothetical protein NTZ72_19030 [Afipia sp.]|nr:hypothetical protein [Afipia sp.]